MVIKCYNYKRLYWNYIVSLKCFALNPLDLPWPFISFLQMQTYQLTLSCPFVRYEIHSDGALTRSAFNTILFVCFLLLFTSLALSEPRYKMRAFEGFLRKRFDESSPVRLEEVQSVDSFWRYFNEPWNTVHFLQLHDSSSFFSHWCPDHIFTHNFIPLIHPASRGGAAHTAGLFGQLKHIYKKSFKNIVPHLPGEGC